MTHESTDLVQNKRLGVFLNVRLVRTPSGYSAEEKYILFWLNLAESFGHVTIFAPTREANEAAGVPLEFNSDNVTIVELPNYTSSFELYSKYFSYRRESIARCEQALSNCDFFVAVVPNAIGLSLEKLAKQKGLDTAFYVRGNLPKTVRFEYKDSWKRVIAVPLSDWLHRITLRRAQHTLTFVVGEGQAQQYANAGVQVQPIITSLIRAADILPARTQEQASKTPPEIVSIGRLSAERGIDVLLDAMAILRTSHSLNPTLKIIGDGPERAALEEKVAALELNNVAFYGFVSDPARLQQSLQTASLMVVASHTEGLPKTVLESLANACPLVSTAVGGIPNLVENGESALLVQPGDPAALAKAMNEVLTDAQVAAQISAGGREVILRQTFEVQRDVLTRALTKKSIKTPQR